MTNITSIIFFIWYLMSSHLNYQLPNFKQCIAGHVNLKRLDFKLEFIVIHISKTGNRAIKTGA